MTTTGTPRRGKPPVSALAASTQRVLAELHAMQADIQAITDPEAPPLGGAREGIQRPLTVDQVAEALGISRSEAYRLVQRGDIAAFRVGRLWRVRPEVVARYKAEGEKAVRERRRVG